MTEPVPRFRIEGREYPIPMQDTLTMDEAILIYDYSGLTLDQVADQPGNPKLIKALVHLAYKRVNPDTPDAEIAELVGGAQLASLMEVEEVVEESPPVRSSSPSETSRSDESPSSGDGSSEPSTPSPDSSDQSSSGPPASVTHLTYDRATSEGSRQLS